MENMQSIVIPFSHGYVIEQVFIQDDDGSWRNWLVLRAATDVEQTIDKSEG